MQRPQPNEKRLKGLYESPGANFQRERLQIAHIFQQTNFKMGKESKSHLDHIHESHSDINSFYSSETNDVYIPREIQAGPRAETIVRYHQRKRENEINKLQSRRVEGRLRKLLPQIIHSPQRCLQK